MNTDLARRLFVTAAEIFCVIGTLVGTGVIGTRVAESSGGALSADATLIAPLGTAFSIWSVIYLGLFAYTIWQWLPRVATTSRERRIGWLAGITMILNAVWLLVTQVGWIWVSVLVILALAVVAFMSNRIPLVCAKIRGRRRSVSSSWTAPLGCTSVGSRRQRAPISRQPDPHQAGVLEAHQMSGSP